MFKRMKQSFNFEIGKKVNPSVASPEDTFVAVAAEEPIRKALVEAGFSKKDIDRPVVWAATLFASHAVLAHLREAGLLSEPPYTDEAFNSLVESADAAPRRLDQAA